MRFTSAGAAARADPAIVCARQGSAGRDWGADGGKQGAQSTVGLEAALGACQEKALELELRLRAAEQRIQAQVRAECRNVPLSCCAVRFFYC